MSTIVTDHTIGYQPLHHWVCYFCVKRGKYATTRGQAERAGKAHDRYCPRPRRPEVSRG